MEEVKTFLDEGYDFIEESCSTEPLSFTDFNETIISEAQTVKSPFKIIGRLAGKFAPVGGFSRNNRYYPESHWKTVLESEEVQRRLKGREMMGMIGHEDSRVGDFQIRNGLISHVVGCLDIREDSNGKPYLYGELDILDTPAGRILKAMHEGGAGLYVSSRGAGKLIDTPGKPYKTVSPQFFLETWDVVARPGFMEAKPVFEQVEVEVQPQIHESTEVQPEDQAACESTVDTQVPSPINELEDKTVESDIKKREDQMYDAQAHANEDPKKAKEATEKFHKAVDLAQAKADREDKILADTPEGPKFYKNEEMEELKGQIEKLAKIIEKVVDDVYETEEPVEEAWKKEEKEQPSHIAKPMSFEDYKKKAEVEEKLYKEAVKDLINPDGSLKCKKANEALVDLITTLADSNISEEKFEEIIDIIREAKEVK